MAPKKYIPNIWPGQNCQIRWRSGFVRCQEKTRIYTKCFRWRIRSSRRLTPIICYVNLSGWWFGTFFIFPYIGKNHPNWLIFFRGVQTTYQDLLRKLTYFFQENRLQIDVKKHRDVSFFYRVPSGSLWSLVTCGYVTKNCHFHDETWFPGEKITRCCLGFDMIDDLGRRLCSYHVPPISLKHYNL
jgi:hypothetical protein